MMLLLIMPVVASALYVRPALVTWMVALYVGPLLTSDKTPAVVRFALDMFNRRRVEASGP